MARAQSHILASVAGPFPDAKVYISIPNEHLPPKTGATVHCLFAEPTREVVSLTHIIV
jgi:hypothetical protein